MCLKCRAAHSWLIAADPVSNGLSVDQHLQVSDSEPCTAQRRSRSGSEGPAYGWVRTNPAKSVLYVIDWAGADSPSVKVLDCDEHFCLKTGTMWEAKHLLFQPATGRKLTSKM